MFYSSQSIIISHPKIIETIIFFELFLFDRNKIYYDIKSIHVMFTHSNQTKVYRIYIYIYICTHSNHTKVYTLCAPTRTLKFVITPHGHVTISLHHF